ncbi:hypothetical protein K439DRAFT_1419601 [Ramaria rubella]|nr:hypothetical protein K439DRAFT_1419601 [Ramaria rubella]
MKIIRQKYSRFSLDHLPEDILLIIFRYLNVTSISNLGRTCRILQAIIEYSGWKAYIMANYLPFPSLTPALENSKWSMGDLVRNQRMAQRSWGRREFISRPLGPEWPLKFHPVMAISASRLVIAAGNALFCYKFMPPNRIHTESPRVAFERAVTFPMDARRDITGIAFDASTGDRGLILSFVHGVIGQITLPQFSSSAYRQNSVRAPPLLYIQQRGQPIRAMSVGTKGNILTIDNTGVATLQLLSNNFPSAPSTVEIGHSTPVKGWSAYLSLRSSSGHAVLGTSSRTPLVVHNITESGLNPFPRVILSPSSRSALPGPGAVYSISGATQTFPSASPLTSDQILVSGWYHGIISIHDLRCATHSAPEGPTLHPVMVMRDPLTLSPIYSLSSVGSHIAAGSAHHSLLHLYDVRSPKTGWSIYLPQTQTSQSSPVYSCILESTRLWAATESRAFVVDFGKVSEHTYPPLPDRGRSRANGNIGWHAPFCEHSMFSNAI